VSVLARVLQRQWGRERPRPRNPPSAPSRRRPSSPRLSRLRAGLPRRQPRSALGGKALTAVRISRLRRRRRSFGNPPEPDVASIEQRRSARAQPQKKPSAPSVALGRGSPGTHLPRSVLIVCPWRMRVEGSRAELLCRGVALHPPRGRWLCFSATLPLSCGTTGACPVVAAPSKLGRQTLAVVPPCTASDIDGWRACRWRSVYTPHHPTPAPEGGRRRRSPQTRRRPSRHTRGRLRESTRRRPDAATRP